MDEFSLINHFFKSIPIKRKDVLLGIGDDAASVHVPTGMELIISTDTLVSGVHFLPEWNAFDIAQKSLLVNISDMAAMAAIPCWVTLALTLPNLDEQWLDSFSKGFNEVLNQYNIDLIGGDTTHGPLSITVTILGLAPKGQKIQRRGAKPGDIIMVTGDLGAPALAVKFLEKKDIDSSHRSVLMDKLLHPKPRTEFCSLLRTYATSAIDISDGLSADLSHICEASHVGALLEEEKILIHPLVTHYLQKDAVDLALSGGDDYEICYTIPKKHLDDFLKELKIQNLESYPIGVIQEDTGIRLKKADGSSVEYKPKGYVHF